MTIRDFLRGVAHDRYLVPSVQRDFVWKPKQIANLFDSLMRQYPIGTMLVWRTRPSENPAVKYRRLYADYRSSAKLAPYVNVKTMPQLNAVLDGQQRATALNIGLRGSYAGSLTAAQRTLHIDLDIARENAGDEAPRYDFEFRSSTPDGEDAAWFPVSAALGLRNDPESLRRALELADIRPNAQRRSTLKLLVRALNEDRAVVIREVRADLDEVLNIFARTNMGGTKLSYVELLMSTASAKMTMDLRSEFEALRERLRGQGFDVSLDRVLKTCFVLLGMKEPKFHVAKLLEHSTELERRWDDIAQALEVGCGLLRSFGLTSRTLRAENALIVAASYAYHRNWSLSHVAADSTSKQRRTLKAVIARTLLIRAYWTGAVDPVLAAANDVFRRSRSKAFPLEALEKRLAASGKPLDVSDALVADLCRMSYSDRQTLVVLSLLFPHMPLRYEGSGPVAKDHIFPISAFSANGMSKAGFTKAQQEVVRMRANQLPNLQLLGGADNSGSKNAKLPSVWWKTLSETERRAYNDQGVRYIPDGLATVENFWDRRKAFLEKELRSLLQA